MKAVSKLLDNQSQIIVASQLKLDSVRTIINSYQEHADVIIRNSYMSFSAAVIVQSAILDLCALYCSGKDHRNSFHNLISKGYISSFNEMGIKSIQTLLSESKESVDTIQKERNKSIAHYDFTENNTLEYNVKYFYLLDTLHAKARDIISIAGSTLNDASLRMSYGVIPNAFAQSLNRLLEYEVEYGTVLLNMEKKLEQDIKKQTG